MCADKKGTRKQDVEPANKRVMHPKCSERSRLRQLDCHGKRARAGSDLDGLERHDTPRRNQVHGRHPAEPRPTSPSPRKAPARQTGRKVDTASIHQYERGRYSTATPYEADGGQPAQRTPPTATGKSHPTPPAQLSALGTANARKEKKKSCALAHATKTRMTTYKERKGLLEFPDGLLRQILRSAPHGAEHGRAQNE